MFGKWYIPWGKTISNGGVVLDFEYIINNSACKTNVRMAICQSEKLRGEIAQALRVNELFKMRFMRYFPEYFVEENSNNLRRK